MAQKNADIFAKYGLSAPKAAPAESSGGDVFSKYGLSAPKPKEESFLEQIKSTMSGNFAPSQNKTRDEVARDIIGGVGDGLETVATPVNEKLVKPIMGALDYLDAPARAGIKAYQDQPEAMQFHPKGLIRPAMAAGKFALDEVRGLKSPADAPSFDEVYKRTDVGRALNNPAIATPVGKFLLRAPGPEVGEYGIDAREALGRDYEATSLDVGRKANEVVGGGLLSTAMPSNLAFSAAPKVLEKIKGAREAFKTAGREALAAERAEQAAPAMRQAGNIDDIPPDPPGGGTPPSQPQKPTEVPVIPETKVDDVRTAATPPNQPPATPPGNVPEPLPPPESSAALEKYLERAKDAGLNTDLPQAAELERAERLLGDMKHPILPAQRNATKDLNSRDKFRALKESGTATGKQISEFEQLQRQEAVQKIDETINQASPSGIANPDGVAQSENLQKQFIENYEQRKLELGKAFNEFDNVAVDPMEHVPQLTDKIAQQIPDFEKYIESVSDEGVKLKPYSKKLGISKQEYNAISDIVTELGSGPVTVKELRNMRGALLREFPNPVDRPKVVSQLRKAMLEHLQDIIAGKNPGRREEIFKTFQDYAINESNLDELERVFGGSFSEIAAGTTKGFASEKVLDRIFANSKNAVVAKSAMGEAAFNEAFASYLAQKKAAWTKEGVFSSRRFANWLQTKNAVFKKAGVDPNTLERLDALTTILKFTADAPSVNPPGTAKTIGLFEAIGNNIEAPTLTPGGILSSGKKAIFGTAGDLRRQKGAARTFDELSGVETKGLLEKAGEKLISPETKALARKMKKSAKAKADELGKTAKDFIDDEEGKFSPEDLLNILKPNEENVFDLKKARGLVGEPKGLLPGEGGNPAGKYDPTKPQAKGLGQSDLYTIKEINEHALTKGLTEKERTILDRAYQRAGVNEGQGPIKRLIEDTWERARQHHGVMPGEDRVAKLIDDATAKSEPRGLLTSLDVERGPVTERPEAGRQIGEIRMTKDGPKKVVHPTEGEIDAHVAGVNQKWMDEISKRIQGGGTPTKEDGERLFKLSQKFKNPELSDRAQQILDQWEVGIGSAEKAAEAERAKKGLIGVDFGGRGESGPKGKRELVDALMSGEKKVPGISIKRGKENPNQGLIDDLWANREKRKPKPVDVPLGGSVELNVSMTNDGGASRPKYRVIESVDDMDGGGYLVENISTGETHTVSDSEIARVFDENGKLVSNKAKPKGGKGKPKKKKD